MTAKATTKRATAAPKKKAETANWVDLPSKLEMAFCHVLMSMPKRNVLEAARRLGLPERDGTLMMMRPRVKRYMVAYQQKYIDLMAEKEVGDFIRAGITRETIASRLWTLANIPPERTRNNISGQVDALDALSSILGFKIQARDMDEFFRGKSDEQIANYLQYGTFEAPQVQ